MPALQTAQVDNYDFGAPNVAIVAAAAATLLITFTGNPTTGDLLEISTPTGELTVDFTNGSPTPGAVACAIGLADTNTNTNLVALLNSYALQLGATAVATTTLETTLTNSTPGSAGNSGTVSTTSSVLTLGTWGGGVDADAAVGIIQFSIEFGGKIHLHFENPIALTPSTITVEFSTDGIHWTAAATAANLVAINGVTLNPLQTLDYTVLARAGVDKFMRVSASGGNRLAMQVRRQQSVGFDLIRM
jgi:hypothetical protein